MSLVTNSDITYIIEKQTGLTGTELDNNFRLLYYSSSIENSGTTLRLYRDINAEVRNSIVGMPDPSTSDPSDVYALPADVTNFDDISLLIPSSSGGITITGNTNNNILTATGNSNSINGESKFVFDGTRLSLTGSFALDSAVGDKNIFLGTGAGLNSTTTSSISIGDSAAPSTSGIKNVAVGVGTLANASTVSQTLAIGNSTLSSLSTGNFNTAVGAEAGSNVSSGASNVFLGYAAGPSSGTVSNKLYINNNSGTPLILGDFSTGHLQVKTAISASLISGSFFGDGSNLTGLSTTAFPHNGNAVITGSLTVSGSSVVVDFTKAASISGSIFSGSFVGNGSGLTGISSNGFPHTGSAVISGSLQVENAAAITGSFTVSGSSPTITLAGVTTIDRGIKVHRPDTFSIGIGANSLNTSSNAQNVAVGYGAACRIDESGPTSITALGYLAGIKAGNCSVGIGAQSLGTNAGLKNTAIGTLAMGSSFGNSSSDNTSVGFKSLNSIGAGNNNVALGSCALCSIATACQNVGVGVRSLGNINGSFNTAIGTNAGICVISGNSNVYIGSGAGPNSSNVTESNQLYINNGSGTPLIKGDFAKCSVQFKGGVSGSYSGSFQGDGTNLTGVTAEWDGSLNGDAVITGSLTVSGSSKIVDFRNVSAISGSIFSGSFSGDGSGLTGLTGVEWNGRRNGNADISGSLIVSGGLDVGGTVTISSGSYPGGPGVELIQVNGTGLTSNTTLYNFLVNATTGYTGFKADYVLTNAAEDSKKVGTVLGSWDRSGNSVVNEEHTLATGTVVGTSFGITSNSSTAAFIVNIPSGTFEINTLITAFKRVV